MGKGLSRYFPAPEPESVYDYTNQAWTVDGAYVRCGHPEGMSCQCYGRLHAGEPADMDRIKMAKVVPCGTVTPVAGGFIVKSATDPLTGLPACCNFHQTGGTQQFPCGDDDGDEGDRAMGEVRPCGCVWGIGNAHQVGCLVKGGK